MDFGPHARATALANSKSTEHTHKVEISSLVKLLDVSIKFRVQFQVAIVSISGNHNNM